MLWNADSNSTVIVLQLLNMIAMQKAALVGKI
jgi:hypothetical protein